jgi:16S rRNA processing protein RimM
MSLQRILLGAIVGAHGIKGAVRVKSFADEPENLFTYGPLSDLKGTRTFELHCIGVAKDCFLAQIVGVTDRDTAEALRGTKLYVAREKLPEAGAHEYYEADLIGLIVQDESGATLGKITGLFDYGAGAFVEVKPDKGESFMIPFRDAFLPVIDLAQGTATATLPEDWLTNEKESTPLADKKKKSSSRAHRGGKGKNAP